MFQDIYKVSGRVVRGGLSVPERPISGEPMGAVCSRRVVEVSERRVISDVIVTSSTKTTITECVQDQQSFSVGLDQAIDEDVALSSDTATVESPLVNKLDDSEYDENISDTPSSSTLSDPKYVNKKPKHIKLSFSKKRTLSALKWLIVCVLFATTVYISIDAYLTNIELKRRLEALPVVATGDLATPEQRQQAEGTDEKEVSANQIDNYVTSADMPRIIKINKLNLRARVLQMGVNPDGSMQAPVGIFDAGWYNGSSRPGTRGAVVIDAHASGPSRQGLFAYLNTLEIGDQIEIERGDGTKLTYQVINKETVPKDSVDMRKLLTVQGAGEEGLNLITCDGAWVKDQSTFSDRTIVYAEKV